MNKEILLKHLEILQTRASVADEVDENVKMLSHVQTIIGGELLKNPKTGTPLLVHMPNKPHVLWVGHVDVVPSSTDQTIKKEGDTWFDRGIFDMKGSIASFLSAFKNSIAQDNVGFLITSDEEVGGRNGAEWFFESNLCNRQNIKALLVGEPTNLEVVTDSKGLFIVGIRILGTSAHASQPWLGVSAAGSMIELTHLLQDKVFKLQPTNEKDWSTSWNIGFLKAGSVQTTNTIPSEAELILDIRFVPQDDPDSIIQSITRILLQLKRQNQLMDFEIVERMKNYPERADENDRIVQNLLRSFQTIGKIPTISKGFGVTDGRHLATLDNTIPIIRFGPVGDGAHSDHEWVSIDSLIQENQILEAFFKSLETV